MKKQNLLILFVGLLMISCVNHPITPYTYNSSPKYLWGYAEFYGAYYKPENGNLNNVISLSLFSDSLKFNQLGQLYGTGQYLLLEDIFVAKTDTILPDGTYTISDSGQPNSVAPGKNDTIDKAVYSIGSTISYFEENDSKSKLLIITSGSFTVSRIDKVFTINFDFITSDKKTLKGSYTGELPHYDWSLKTNATSVRRKISHNPAH